MQHRIQPRLVVVVKVEKGPPRVPFVVIGAVADPAREGGILRHVVEAVEDRAGNTAADRLVAAQLQLLQAHVEDPVGVGHLFAADNPLAAQMCRRGDIFVDHGVGPAAAVVRFGHLLARFVFQIVCRPGFPFWNIHAEAAFQREKAPSVGLRTGLHPEGIGPAGKHAQKTFFQQFRLGGLEIIAHPLDDSLQRIADLNRRRVGGDVAHLTAFKQNEVKIGHDIIASACLELRRHVVRPVGALKLHAVREKSPQIAAHHTHPPLDCGRHPAQVTEHRCGIVMVKYRPVSTQGPVNHLHETINLHQCRKGVIARGNVEAEGTGLLIRHQIHSLIHIRTGGLDKDKALQLHFPPHKSRRDLRVSHGEQRILGNFQLHWTNQPPRTVDKDFGPVCPGKKFAAIRPSGTDNQIGSHAQGLGRVQSHLQRINPSVGKPGEGGYAHILVTVGGELNRIDFHAAYARIFQQVQLPDQLLRIDLVPVPPPAHHRAAGHGRILEQRIYFRCVCRFAQMRLPHHNNKVAHGGKKERNGCLSHIISFKNKNNTD